MEPKHYLELYTKLCSVVTAVNMNQELKLDGRGVNTQLENHKEFYSDLDY
jgi:hypothetical protein